MLESMGKAAKEAAAILGQLSTADKNKALNFVADELMAHCEDILKVNAEDVARARDTNVKAAFIDRLTLNEKRIKDMADGLRSVALLTDPVGEIVQGKTLPNGLVISQKRVPFGVVAIIFESRPNVAADAFGLCLKTGNAVILRGGKEALATNVAQVEIFQNALAKLGLPKDAVQIISDPDRALATELMRMNKYVDVLIPRGSASLINTVIQNSTVPCIQTGVGNCHIYVDESADFAKAIPVILNAKVQRPGVCNAAEKLLVHEKIAKEFIPMIARELAASKVEMRCDGRSCELVPGGLAATEEDWYTEYEDYIIGIKIVKDIEEAIAHINKYGTQHSEAIITEDYTNSLKFQDKIDAACVYVNASTRFTDGGQFGLGAEIGISTQKLHARGPMGLRELTTTKYIILGTGQVRE